MVFRPLELTLISADGLKDVNLFSHMEVYAVASFSGDPRSAQRTATDRAGGRSPSWSQTLRFNVPASPSGGDTVRILLRAERALGDRDVGEVVIPVRDLLADAKGDGPTAPKYVAYNVRSVKSGKPHGVINVSYKFGEVVNSGAYSKPSSGTAAYPPPQDAAKPYPPPATAAAAGGSVYPPPSASNSVYPPPPPAADYAKPANSGKSEPVTAYPAYPPAYNNYPPQQAGYAYPAPPPPPAYGGYAPQPYGYAAPAPVQQPRRNNMGLGLGAGLLGGALGGLLLGEVISDVGDAGAYDAGYDAGYDNGFDDGGGFDF